MDIKDFPIFNTVEVTRLQIGDIISIHFPQNDSVEHYRIDKIEPENFYAEISNNQSSLVIDSIGKWRMLYISCIYSKLLSDLGFSPASEEIVYGNTCKIWVKNEPSKTWTLTHDDKNMTWTLELDMIEDGVPLPIRIDTNLIYIHQIQHCLRNPEIMKSKL